MIRFALALIALATPRADRDAVVGDTIERLENLRATQGDRAARRWLRRETIRVVWAAPAHRRAVRRARHSSVEPGKAPAMSWIRHGWPTDARHSVRALAHAPGHVLTAVGCLGIGLAASVTVFSILNSLFYAPLPGIADRDRLVRVSVQPRVAGARPSSAATRELPALYASRLAPVLASEADLGVIADIDGEATRAAAAFVSGNYFRLLGTPQGQGRLIGEIDDRPGADPVVAIGDAFWRARLGARPDVIGRRIVINGRPLTVVGIAPAGFGGLELSEVGGPAGSRIAFWLPRAASIDWPGAPAAGEPWHALVLRLPEGVSRETAAAELTTAVSGLSRGSPPAAVQAVVSPLNAGPGGVPADIAIMLVLFLAVPVSVLAVGCANAANLQLTRATARAAEISVRLSLGASRLRVVRLLALEAAVVAVLAALAGLTGTTAALGLIESFVPLSLDVDWRVLVFTCALVAIVVILTGLAPAWLATRQAIGAGLRHTAQAGGLGHRNLRATLVVVQVALSLVLLVVGTLFARSLQVMHAGVPPVTRELLVADLDLTEARYTGVDGARLVQQVTDRLAADPRVLSVAWQGLQGLEYQSADSAGSNRGVRGRFVTPDWFRTMEVRPIAGRLLTPADRLEAVVVNQRFAEGLLSPPPGPRLPLDEPSARRLVGHSLRLRDSEAGPARLVRIAGIVANLPRLPDLHDDPAIYLPMTGSSLSVLSLAVRTSDPAAMLPDVRRTLTVLAPQLPWSDLTTGEARLATRLDPWRYLVLAASGLGVTALLLAAAGLYAVLSYTVLLRRHEIGVRMAIGAQPGDVARLVLTQSLRLAALGLVTGLALAMPLTSAAEFLFVGVSPLDPAAMTLPIVVLVATALAAAALPARRAARVDPVQALRQE